MRTRDTVRRGERPCVAQCSMSHVSRMSRAMEGGSVGEVFTAAGGRGSKVLLFDSDDKWSGTQVGRRSMQAQVRGAEWGLRWEVGVQTEDMQVQGMKAQGTPRQEQVQVAQWEQECREQRDRCTVLEGLLQAKDAEIQELIAKEWQQEVVRREDAAVQTEDRTWGHCLHTQTWGHCSHTQTWGRCSHTETWGHYSPDEDSAHATGNVIKESRAAWAEVAQD